MNARSQGIGAPLGQLPALAFAPVQAQCVGRRTLLGTPRQAHFDDQKPGSHPPQRGGAARLLAAVSLAALGLLLAACGGGESPNDAVARESALTANVAFAQSRAGASSCATCAFGPITLVRQRGRPETKGFAIVGDPNADYVIDINDDASQGADSSVVLDEIGRAHV